MTFVRKISQSRFVLENLESRHAVTILCALAWTLTGPVEAIEPKPTDSPGVELLRDPLLSHGVTQGYANHLPATDRRRSKYGNASTTWPHFLIGQRFAKDNDPAARIPDEDKLVFDRYNRLRFRIDIQFNHLLKNSAWDHREEYGAANHAIFYIAFVLMPKSASRLAVTGKFYILAPAIYSEGDNQHVSGALPWLAPDQFGDGVYFSGAQPILQAGRPMHDIDVKQIIREGLSAAAQKALAQGKAKAYRPENYFLGCLLVGWEVWGGFDTDVEFSNLSLRGTP